MRSWFFLFIALTLFTSVLTPYTTLAQVGASTEALTVRVTPEHPRPYDTITITPVSNLINLPASSVTISVNGSVIEEGSGGRSANFILGGPGSRATVRVTAVSGGQTYSADAVIRPNDVALILEPLTTTHPLYRGAALASPEARLRIVALADIRSDAGTRIAPNSLSYTWYIGSRVLTEESGIGRSVLSATAPLRYRDADVSVVIATVDGSREGRAAMSIAPVGTKLTTYQDDPLLGIDFAHALSGAFTLQGEEETFHAVPFNFKSVPALSWTLNGSPAGLEPSLTVRTTSNNAGTAAVGVGATGQGGEAAQTSFTVNFAARRGLGIFGL